MYRRTQLLIGATLITLAAASPAHAQLGALISPGALTRAHAKFEGLANCEKCHEPGQRVSATRCLACHKPIADRIAAKRGVHRRVERDCVTCHVEHMGRDAELRPFNVATFNHAVETGYPLTGKHQALAQKCAACHKTRSFLDLETDCQSCHRDVHKGALGPTCTTCHSTDALFTAARTAFDHTKTSFPLSGAHGRIDCARCHADATYKSAGTACTSCHKDPHQPSFSTTCSTCHTSGTWKTRRVDHSKTNFQLVGKHAAVDCAKCHRLPPMKEPVVADTCQSCHQDVHRGSFVQDCKACHDESSFTNAPFDHSRTAFVLTGRHQQAACSACHKTTAAKPTVAAATKLVDFRGLQSACASCHKDVHQQELGPACETCHTTTNFRVTNYVHRTALAFFVGKHVLATCDACHVRLPAEAGGPARFTGLNTACVTCHKDVHLGQLSSACETCHAAAAPSFSTMTFTHAASSFKLRGAHSAVACAKCHVVETADFPAGRGTARRLKPISTTCATCHRDPHLGQLEAACETCHLSEATFKVAGYRHRQPNRTFFAGRHATATCQACHPSVTEVFPAGRGTANRYKTSTACTTCHRDVHNGSLGDDCIRCHKP